MVCFTHLRFDFPERFLIEDSFITALKLQAWRNVSTGSLEGTPLLGHGQTNGDFASGYANGAEYTAISPTPPSDNTLQAIPAVQRCDRLQSFSMPVCPKSLELHSDGSTPHRGTNVYGLVSAPRPSNAAHNHQYRQRSWPNCA